MFRYHVPPRLTAALLSFVAVVAAEANTPKSGGSPCPQKTFQQIENHSGSFEIISRPLMEAPVVQPVSLRVGQTVQIDRALLARIPEPGAESGR